MNMKATKALLIFALIFAGILLLLGDNHRLQAAPASPVESVHFVEYDIPVANSEPGAIAVEAPGQIWFTMPGTDQIGNLVVDAGGNASFEFYDLAAGSDPYGIVYDGQFVWYTAMGTNKLGKLDPALSGGSAITEYDVTTVNSGPADVDVAPSGLIWFTQNSASQVASFDPQTLLFEEYVYTTRDNNPADPEDIHVVTDDRILFTTPTEKTVVEFIPSSYGDPNLAPFRRFPVSDPGDLTIHTPGDVLVNERGHVWVSTPERNALAERSDLTQQIWAFHFLSNPTSDPTALASSVDGDHSIIWFVEPGAGRVGRFLKTTSGKIVGFRERNLPTPNSQPHDIAVDANGHAWISERGANKIAVWLPPYDLRQTFLPIVMNNHDATLSDPLFGVQMYGTTGEASRYAEPLVGSGATWLRVPVCWECTEPTNRTPDAYDWQSVDDSLAAASYSGVKIIATISMSPDWAAPYPLGPLYPEHLDEFAEFNRALVERYDGDGVADAPGSPVVRYWEYFNEPDAKLDNWVPGWGDSGTEYANMLKAVYPAVKSADPRAQVLFGGIAHDYFLEHGGPFVYEFLDDVLAAGAGAYFDIMNFHYYPIFSHTWAPPPAIGLIEKTEFIRDRLRSHGLEKPFMITEAGWHSDGTGTAASTPEIQARYVAALFTQSLAADIDAMIWWMLYDPGGTGLANGLVTNAPVQEKPAYDAFQTIVAQLGTAHHERALTDQETGSEDVEVHQFRDNALRRTVYVAWLNPIETDTSKMLRLPVSQATVRDIYGGAYSVRDGEDGRLDGHITLPVSGRPLYVEVDW